MLKIRLQRTGRKHEPTFRVVLTDSRNSTKSGKYIEVLGSYDPRKSNEKFEGEKIKEWISKGAKPTATVHNLLISHKIIEGKKINVLPKKTPPAKETTVKSEQPAEVQEEIKTEQTEQAEPEGAPATETESESQPSAEEPKAEQVESEPTTETSSEKTE